MKFNLTNLLPSRWQPYAKYIYAVLAFAAYLVAQGLIDGNLATWITAITGLILVPGATYHAENRTAYDGEHAETDYASDVA